MKSRFRLGFEHLEQRDTPATSGIGWGYAKHLTLSFVPDGTNVNGQTSALFQTMNAVAPTANWEGEILRSFQSWAQVANLNVDVVGDSGDPLGCPGAVQGDPRFGDIRISAVPLPMDTIATNTPYLRSGSTWAGDVVINSNYLFGIGGANGTVDLYTAILNEAGNVFGVLDSTTDTTSGTYYQYSGPKTGINASNISDMQSLYGVRLPDSFEGSKGNDTIATASSIDFKGQSIIQADISTATDVDFYKITVPSGTTALNIQLNAKGNSTLVGSVSVYNAAQQLVATASQNGPFGVDPSLVVSAPAAGTYYVRVASAPGAVLTTGSYKLKVVFDSAGGNSFKDKFAVATSNDLIQYISRELTASGMNISTDQIIKAVVQTDEVHTNDLLSKASDFKTLNFGTDTAPRVIGLVQGAISDSTDVDFYKVTAPSVKTGTLRLGVVVWALDTNGLAPRVDVFDKNGNPVAAQILMNQSGTYTVELGNVPSGASYSIKVSAMKASGSHATGQYNMQVTFDTAPAAVFNTNATDTLTAATPQKTSDVTVPQNQLMQFVLGGSTSSGVAMLRMDIFDSNGNVVYTLATYSDQPAVMGSVYLPAGTYKALFTAVAAPGATLGNTTFSLLSRKLSDPIGPITVGSTTTNNTNFSGTVPPPTKTPTLIALLSSWTNPYYW